MRGIFFIALFLTLSIPLLAQSDTEFWFAPPEVSAFTISGGIGDRPIQLRISSSTNVTNIQITMPANPAFTPITQVMSPNSTATINLTPWIDQLETKPANQVLNSGLLIRSDNPITAYYEAVSSCNGFCNPEFFILKGKNALGTDFFIPLQNNWDNNRTVGYDPVPTNSFDIVATEDNTTVTILPTKPVVGHSAGTPYSIVLNHGQTYSATGVGFLGIDHPTGSSVHADKPVAITMKDDLLSNALYGACADLAGDQIIPVDRIGTEYIAIKGFLVAPYDKVFIVATKNNTTVTIDGLAVGTFNAGQSYMHTLSLSTAHITSSEPIYVSQLTGGGCEVGLGVLPPLECTGSQEVVFTRTASDALYLDLLAPAGAEGAFLVNGSSTIVTAADFAPVPNTGGQWVFMEKLISTATIPAGGIIRIQNPVNLFHAGVLHGDPGWGFRFGYFSDFNKFKVTADLTQLPVCKGDDIHLNALAVTGTTYAWTGPNSFTSPDQSPVITNVDITNTGRYYVLANYHSCHNTDSVDVVVNDKPQLTLIDTAWGCTWPLVLDAGAGFNSYAWSTGAASQTIQVASTGKYFITVKNLAGCAAKDSIYTDIKPLILTVQPGGPEVLCIGSSLSFTGSPAQSYQWYNNDVTIPGETTDQLTVTQQGNYSLIGINSFGCKDTALVTVTAKPKPSLISPPEVTLCSGQTDTLKVKGGDTYSWSPATYLDNPSIANPATTPLDSIIYNVHVTENFCHYDTTIKVIVNAKPSTAVEAQKSNDIDCSQPTTQLSASGGAIYAWTPPLGLSDPSAPNPVVSNIPSDMTYYLQVTAVNGCIGYDTIQVKVLAEGKATLFIPSAFTPNNDGKNDCFGISASAITELQEFSVWNRWGQRIFITQNPYACWDGTVGGKPQDSGAFVYMVRAKTLCGSIFKKGIVMLIR